jgi:hypothetical protein
LFELVSYFCKTGCVKAVGKNQNKRYWGQKEGVLLWVGIGGNCKSLGQKTLQKLDAGGWF